MTYFLLVNLLLAIPPESRFGRGSIRQSKDWKSEFSYPKVQSVQGEPTTNNQQLIPDITILNSTPNGISFRYSFNDEQLVQEKVLIGGKEYVIFNIKNTAHKEPIGQLDLPSKEVVIGIAQQGEILVTAEPSFVNHIDNIEIPVVPYKSWDKVPEYRLTCESHPPLANRTRFSGGQDVKSGLYPEHICEIKEIGYFRDIRIARIKIYPIQYNNITKQVMINSNITVNVQFSCPAQNNLRPDYFDGVAKDILLNWENALSWKSDPRALKKDYHENTKERKHEKEMLNTGYSKYPQGFFNWYKIKIESTGVYKITYDELKRAGIPIGQVDPRTIRLFNIANCTSNVYYPDTMSEIPIYITGEADSSFDKKDYVIFFAVSTARYTKNRTNFYNNPFTKYNYYWLTWGFSLNVSGLGKRFEPVTSTLNGTRVYSAENYVRLEKDRDCPARSGLLWIWEFYTKDGNLSSKTFDLALELVNPESLFYIAPRFYARTDSNWIKISLNSNELDSFFFRGQSSVPPAYDFIISRRIPLNPANNLSFTLYKQRGQDVFFDFINVRYFLKLELTQHIKDLYFYSKPGNFNFAIRKAGSKPIILDISDYHAPKMFTDYYKNRDTIIFGAVIAETSFYYVSDESKARKVLSIEQRNPGQTINYTNLDYIIVTPDELYESALLFENYRRNNVAGISQAEVKAMPLSKIYDDFTFGIEEPGAIKRLFKKYRPYYGLLLGDGTYDYRSILGFVTFPSVPAYEQGYDIDFQVYSMAALSVDAWYADFDGGGWSPDMAIGRITARTTNEVRRYYDKLVNYESRRSVGLWNKRFILLSDDEWQGEPGAADGFIHISNNETLEGTLYNSTNGRFRYLDLVKIYLTEYPYSGVRDKRKARESLISEINKGASLWCFFGHGAGFQLAHEQALHISHIPLIRSERRNFIGFYGSCGVGRFEDTKYESIAEELVRKADGGIATIAASKATHSSTNESFAISFFRRLISLPDSTIGGAFLRSSFIDYYYHLFGDPATVPALPRNFQSITTTPDIFNAGQVIRGRASASGNDYFSAGAYSTKWRRQYQSAAGTIHYNLSGYELFRGIGRTLHDSINFRFTVPVGLPRNVRYDVMNGGGSYTELPNSARVHLVAYGSRHGQAGQNQIYSFLKDSIVFYTLQVNTSDIFGPKIALYNGDKRLKPNDNLPVQFTLTGVLSDSSGILLVPLAGLYPRLIVKKQPNRIIQDVDLTTYFNYDIGNFGQGRFSYPIDLDTGDCVITIKAADNLRNIGTESVAVRVEASQRLTLDKVLYYSAPNSRTSYFTFNLSQPASVSIKIYTINGRLVKTLYERPCSFGYNQIVWDGLDEEGIIPANGVYLYKIQGRSFQRGNEEKTSAIEKFIILH